VRQADADSAGRILHKTIAGNAVEIGKYARDPDAYARFYLRRRKLTDLADAGQNCMSEVGCVPAVREQSQSRQRE
jgi:hypothetical protein